MTSGDPGNQQDKIQNSRVLVCKMPGEGFPVLKDANMQEALNSHAAELTEEDPEQQIAFSEPDDEDYGNAVERTTMKTCATLVQRLDQVK